MKLKIPMPELEGRSQSTTSTGKRYVTLVAGGLKFEGDPFPRLSVQSANNW